MESSRTPELVNALVMYAGPDTLLHIPTLGADTPVEFPTEAAVHAYAAELLFDFARRNTVFTYRVSPRLTHNTYRLVYTLEKIEEV